VTHISEEPFASIFKAEGGEKKFIQNVENYPANYTTSYRIPTNQRTFKLKKQQRDSVQSNEESKKGRKTDGQTDREKEGKRSCPQKKHHIIKRVPAISSPLARKGLYLFRPHFQPPLPSLPLICLLSCIPCPHPCKNTYITSSHSVNSDFFPEDISSNLLRNKQYDTQQVRTYRNRLTINDVCQIMCLL